MAEVYAFYHFKEENLNINIKQKKQFIINLCVYIHLIFKAKYHQTYSHIIISCL